MIGALQMGGGRERWDSGNMNESRTIPSLHTYMNSIHVYILRTEYRMHTVHICSVLHAWMYYYPSTRIRAALRTEYLVHTPYIDNGKR